MYQRKTKIVATIGPATESEANLEAAIKAGLNVIRCNFSHGDFAEHTPKAVRGRKIAKKLGLPIAILQDLSGPKIRTGEFYQERVMLTAGEKFVLTTEKIVGDEHKVHVNYPKLPQEVAVGGIIFLDDGKKKLEITAIKGKEIHCKILVGGETKGKRGVNLPGANLSLSSLTAKDKKDLEWGIDHDVEYMAISFVRTPAHVEELRKILAAHKKSHIKIISKIETEAAVANIDAIIAASDGIMVARGDLAMEVPAEYVPIIQKDIIAKCNKIGKPVITATQMLESMINSPVPTRAEVSDVANAVFDGTDAVMLSEETTLGKYPIEAIATMARVATYAETHIEHGDVLEQEHLEKKSITDSVSYAALHMAHEVGATAMVALSNTGYTGRMIARHRPHLPVIVLTQDARVYNQLSLQFACHPILTKPFASVLGVMTEAKKLLLAKKLVTKGDTVVIVAGIPFGKAGSTNMSLVHKI
jgi:pyruvate kinase